MEEKAPEVLIAPLALAPERLIAGGLSSESLLELGEKLNVEELWPIASVASWYADQ